jgi:hypothetical protein
MQNLEILSTLGITRIPFVSMDKSGLDSWTKAKASKYSEFKEIPTTYVNLSDLIEKAKNSRKYQRFDNPLIWEGTVGFMSRSWVNKYRGTEEYNYQFGTGLYHYSTTLLLVEDVFNWAHHRLSADKVRSAFDIICELQKQFLSIN